MFSRASRNTSRLLRARSGYPRFQSSSSPPGPRSDYAALYGGLAGGSLVLAGTYAWYHLSGTRTVIQTAQSTIATVQNTKNKFIEATPTDPVAALAFLRYMTKTFVPFPGADKVFDELDKAAEKHGEKVVDIVRNTYNDVHKALSSGNTSDSGDKVFSALQRGVIELQKLTGDVAGDVFGPMLDNSPELKRVLGTSYDQFKSTVDKHGPEAQRIASDTYTKLAKLFSQGVNPATINEATTLLQKKSQEISQLVSKSSGDAWEAARNSAQPLLDRLPDLKKVLDENVENLTEYVGEERIKIIKDLYSGLEDISKSGKSAKEIKADAEKLVREKVDELRKQGGAVGKAVSGDFDLESMLNSAGGLEALKKIPGLSGLVDQIPRLKELQAVADKRGPEAKKLLDETYKEIRKVLDSKLEEAKNIGGEAKEDMKKSGKKG